MSECGEIFQNPTFCFDRFDILSFCSGLVDSPDGLSVTKIVSLTLGQWKYHRLNDHILAQPKGLNPLPRRHEIHNFSAGLHEHNHAFTIQLSRTTVKVLKFDGFHYMVILAPK